MTMADAGMGKILRVRAADGGARLLITLEAGENAPRETLAVYAARLSHLPTVGEIGAAALSHLRRESAVCAALGIGLRSLAASGGSRVRLLQKLRARGIEEDAAEEAVRELAARGYLKENESAMREAERGLTKLWGNRRILADLRAKGYNEEVLRPVRARLADEDSVARCKRLLSRKRIITLENAGVDKLIASLLRFGYSQQEIREALRDLVEEN